MPASVNVYRENIFFVTVLVTAICFPFSEAMVSILTGALLLQALVLGSWNHPSVKLRSIFPLLFLISIFFVYVVWLLACDDLDMGIYELRKSIFWLIVPLAFCLSPPLTAKRSYIVLLSFVLAVFISSLISTGKLVLFDFSDVFSNRKVSYVSHIRFSFQVILSIFILGYFFINRTFRNGLAIYWSQLFILLWLLVFLMVAQSLLAIIAFAVTLFIFLVYYLLHLPNRLQRTFLFIGAFLIVAIPILYVVRVVNDYYDFEEINSIALDKYTQSGNLYFHDFNDQARENGNLVFIYVSHDELRREWSKRSLKGYDEKLNGFPLHITLFRYMSSLGLRKDSVGLSKLSDDDIRQVEKGLTNYKFKRRFFSLYPRIYETIWELDAYWRSDDPNAKSLAQRIEFLKASMVLVRENPWFGIGTGNSKAEYNRVYDQMRSNLDNDKRATSHNQYLNYLVKFGWVGFLWIFMAVLAPFLWLNHRKNSLFTLFLLMIAFANLGDSNLETHMGLSFFTFFYCFFLWNSPDDLKSSLKKLV